MVVLIAILAALLARSLVYRVLILVASRRSPHVAAPVADTAPPVSVLKPLCGHDEGLEKNLRSFFTQDHPVYEILLAVHRMDDPAVAVAEKIRQEFSTVESRLLVTGESPVPNAKAHNLKRLMREARYELLVMPDSDVRVNAD